MKNENAPVERPTIRKPIGVAIILAMITLLSWAIGNFATDISQLHFALQAIIYLIAGVIWIAPLKPLLRWMETGKWRE
jgi:Protein of unknown function (DUF2842)